MRTFRLSLAGMVILALLGGLSGAVLAQAGDERVDFVTIESTEVLSESGFDASGNEIIRMAKEASDPRLSGTWTEVWSCRGDPVEVCVASVRVENEGGTWLGRAEGFGGPPVGAFDFTVLEGQGDYAGLTALRQVTFHPEDGDAEVLAVYESELPLFPELPAAATAASGEGAGEGDQSAEATVEDEAEAEAVEDEEPDATAEEEGEELSGSAVYIDGLRTWQYWEDEDTIYELEMSDPRANGTYTEFDFVGDGYDSESEQPSVAALGHVTLVNDGGSWSGHESAVWDDEMGWRLTAWLAGEDAYEGLTIYLHAHRFPVYSTPEMEFDGVIFEGEPPVMLEAVKFLAE